MTSRLTRRRAAALRDRGLRPLSRSLRAGGRAGHARRARRAATALAGALVLLTAAACGSSAGGPGGSGGPGGGPGRTTVTLALDWTPNTNYTGIYVAEAKGYFAAHGVTLKKVPYATTAPETLISHRQADFGFSYQAGVAYAQAAGQDVVSVFAPDQRGIYAIGVRANRADIATPRDLDGKTYAGFGTPDEQPELRYVIQHAGGRGTFKDVTLNTSAYDALYTGKADFSITASTWEAVEAKLAGEPLKLFAPTDYGFPDQYSTLIATSRAFLGAHADAARRFLAAASEGYAYAAAHPDEAADIVVARNPGVFSNPRLVHDSEAALVAGGFLRDASGQVGTQNPTIWARYGDFLFDHGLLVDGSGKKLAARPDWSAYYTDAYLPADRH